MSCADSGKSAGPGSNWLPPSNNANKQAQPEQLHPRVGQLPFQFTQSQLSLALSIQNSKPEGVSVRDYCLQLRKYIQQGKPKADADHRSIDTAEFWKEQCSRLHSEKKALEARVAELKSIGVQGSDPVTGEESMIFNLPAIAQLKSLENILSDEPKIIPPDLGHPRTLILLKESLALHRLLQDDAVSTEVLLSAVQSCISEMHSAVGHICKMMEINRDTIGADQRFIRPLNTVAAIFNVCLKGLSHLCRDMKGRCCKGQAIYSIVHFFKANIRHLDTLCMNEATHRSSSIGNDVPDSINTHTWAQPGPIFTYAKFLASLLASSELRQTHLCNIEVLEGMYAALLDDLGRLVSQSVFREYVPSSEKPGRIGSAVNEISHKRVLALEIEGHYLAMILRATMEGNLDKDEHSLAAMLVRPKASSPITDKAQLLSRAKQRLQETLLKGIFGKDVEEWKNALKAPEVEDSWDSHISVATQVKGDTFMESVWSAVGWDLVLSR